MNTHSESAVHIIEGIPTAYIRSENLGAVRTCKCARYCTPARARALQTATEAWRFADVGVVHKPEPETINHIEAVLRWTA